MQKLVIYTAVLGLAGAAGLVTSFAVGTKPAPVEIATPVPLDEQMAAASAGAHSATSVVTLANMAGGSNSVEDWQGKPRLVNFWATWCAPCRREIPLLKSLQTAQQPEGLQVIGIAHDEMDAVIAYAEETDFNYPVLVGEVEVIAAAEAFGVPLKGLPFTLVLSAEGELVNTHVGEMDAEEAEVIIDVLSKLEAGELSLDAAREALE
ncbi:MAG: TlpA disulfide reductase family protein [Pseudomonadota bacterium]